MSLRPLLGPALVFAATAAAGALFFLDLCDLIYGCGCVAWWEGAANHCNIQVPGPPDCPFCARPAVSAGAYFAGVGAQAVVLLRSPPPGLAPPPGGGAPPPPPARGGGGGGRGRAGLAGRALAALAAFGGVIAAIGVALGLVVGYWI